MAIRKRAQCLLQMTGAGLISKSFFLNVMTGFLSSLRACLLLSPLLIATVAFNTQAAIDKNSRRITSGSPQKDAGVYMRVRLMSSSQAIKVSGLGLAFQGKERKFSPASISSMHSAKIRWEPARQNGAWLVESSPLKTERYRGRSLALQGELLRVGRQLVPSRLLLFAKERPGREPLIDVVAVIDVEKYLLGVLAGEMPASWPLEALKAQAVASRSYALFRRDVRRQQRFHVESDIQDQVFDFHGSQHLSASLRKKIRRAVEETRGQVLLTADHQLLEAFYHADCGGQTEVSHEVWQGRQNLPSVKDPYCQSSPYRRWKRNWSKSFFQQRLQKHFGPIPKKIKKISRSGKTHGGRVRDLLFAFTDGTQKSLPATLVRHSLGTTKMKSTSFSFRVSDKSIQMVGKGYGHGVGLCQWGTRTMAKKGFNYRQILAHYYRGTHLSEMNSLSLEIAQGKSLAPKGHSDSSGKEEKSTQANNVEQI